MEENPPPPQRKRRYQNRLNDLDPKTWLKFQKSWFVHNPPRRRREALRHPAKFPESLAQEFIEFFTKRGQVVFDPMAGTGSSLVAALRAGRNSYGVELNTHYAALARQWIAAEISSLGEPAADLTAQMITGDAARLAELIPAGQIPPIDYVLTSPPYWDMLRARGAATQRQRRASSELDTFYSNDPQDLGNIADYNLFLERLIKIYANIQPFLRQGAYLTIVVKNVKKGGRLYPLAWDLARTLGQVYTLKDEKIWCQDDIRLAPYGLGSAWVSNTFHHYCLQFRNESPSTFDSVV
jgi:DNA modification methylase